MPVKSPRQVLLNDIPLAVIIHRLLYALRALAAVQEELAGTLLTDELVDITRHPDEVHDIQGEDRGSTFLVTLYLAVRLDRYLAPRIHNVVKRSTPLVFLHSLDEKRFRQEVRLSPTAFHGLVQLLAPHTVFQSRSQNFQCSVEVQLAVFLTKLGRFGNGGSVGILARVYGISEGCVQLYYQRCMIAILSLEKDVVVWPTVVERQRMSRRIASGFGFPRCVGFVDGTLFPVYAKPSKDGEDFYTRKGFYGMAGMVVCDDRRRITHVDLGWPGSAHDARVWSNSFLSLNPGRYFSGQEYLLADSGYSTGGNLVAGYRKVRGVHQPREQVVFNKRLAQCRYVNEHAIGILKGRFQSLRGMRCDISKKKGAAAMIYSIRCAVVLHNLVLDEDGDDEEWQTTLQDCNETESDFAELVSESHHRGDAAQRSRSVLSQAFVDSA